MQVLTKYISKEFIKLQIFCQVIIIFLFLMTDFVLRIDNFIKEKVTDIGVIMSYFLYKTPYIMVQMIPVATLISVIVLFRLMKNHREILALKTCGINIIRVSQIILTISLFISLFAFIFSESVVPYASSKSNEIWDIKVNKEDPNRFYGSDQIWFKSGNAIYWIKHFDNVKNIMEGPTLNFFDKNFKLIKRIEAKRGVWKNEKWNFEDGIIQEMQADGEYQKSEFKNMPVELPETPKKFKQRKKNAEDMTYSQLKKASEEAKNEGYSNSEYLVDMNVKIAFPFVSLVLTLLGIPIALQLKTGGIPLAVATGMGLCFLYYVVSSVSSVLGHSGIFPPFLAAWTANLLFIFIGIYLMISIER
jgi:lipopolysaccharide export system permease protein